MKTQELKATTSFTRPQCMHVTPVSEFLCVILTVSRAQTGRKRARVRFSGFDSCWHADGAASGRCSVSTCAGFLPMLTGAIAVTWERIQEVCVGGWMKGWWTLYILQTLPFTVTEATAITKAVTVVFLTYTHMDNIQMQAFSVR